MIKVSCPGCGKRYAIRGRITRKTIECPKCKATIILPATPATSKSALREELSRLASQESAAVAPKRQPGPEMEVLSEEDERLLSHRGVVLAVVAGVVLLLALAGGVFFLVVRTRARAPLESEGGPGPVIVQADTSVQEATGDGVEPEPVAELPAGVTKALEEARAPVPPGAELQALNKWKQARDELKPYAVDHPDLWKEVGENIRDLEARLQAQRQEHVNNLIVQLEMARTAIQEKKLDEARKLAQTVIKELSEDKALSELAGDLADQARAVLASARQPAGNGGVEPPPIVDGSDLLIDKPRGVLRWRAENWANPVEVKLEGSPRADQQYVSVNLKRGSEQKWVVSMQGRLDLSQYEYLMMDMQVKDPVRIALGVWVGNQLYESRDQEVRPGNVWRTAAFNLTKGDFKCATTNWKYGAKIANPEGANRISLFFYSRLRSPVYFCNVRLHGRK